MNAMSNKDKKALAEILRDHAEMIVESVGSRNGYTDDIDHLDPEEIRAQLNKWLDRLP